MPATNFSSTRASRPNPFQYAALISGLCSPAFFFAGFIAAGFIPPLRPALTAEEVALHYRTHEAGVRVGASLMLFSGMFYLPYSALISEQMERIPNVPRGVSYTQLCSGVTGFFIIVIPALILAILGYRTERDPATTLMLNDSFWIFAVVPFTSFFTQNWSFAYAILCDRRSKSLFPRYVGYINIIVPVIFSPAVALHCVKSGVIAWDGALTFWLPAVSFGSQCVIDTYSMFKAIKAGDQDSEESEDPEDVGSNFAGSKAVLPPTVSKD